MSRLEKNVENVKAFIRRSENPHPATVVLTIFITILTIYAIYICGMKPTIEGIWLDGDKKYEIRHDKWSDVIVINNKYYGNVSGSTVYVIMYNKMRLGVWVNNVIKWTDGTTWCCEYGY